MDKEPFVLSILSAIQKELPTASPETLHLIAAHACYESGYGVATAYKKGNNLFNLTRAHNDQGPVILGGDLEFDKSGAHRIIQRFCAYPDIHESIRHYLKFISHKRYQPALQHLFENRLEAFLAALYKGGYFTLPFDRYVAGFKAVLREVEDFSQE